MSKIVNAEAKVRKNRATTPSTRRSSPPKQVGDVLGRVTKAGTATHLKGVLFGPPKTGKTVAATNTERKALLVLTDPGGDLALHGAFERPNVDVFRPESWKDLNDVTEAMQGSDHGYEVVSYDSVTFMFELVGNADVAETFRENKDIRRPYGKAGAAINQIVYNASMLNMDVIFTAHLKAENEEDDNGVALDPEKEEYPMTLAVTPMIYKVLTPAVSFIGRTYKKAGYQEVGNTKKKERVTEYWVSFDDRGKSPAGTRLEIPEKVQNLNLDSLLATIKKGDS